MKLSYAQLAPHLTKQLASLYLVSGDELLLVQDAFAMLREAARQAGFVERMVVTSESGSDWAQLFYTEAHSLSLFATKKIIELDLSTKFNSAQGKTLEEYILKPLPDVLLLIRIPKIDAKTEKSVWFQKIEKHGVFLQVWPISLEQLPQWIIQRAKKAKLELTPQAAEKLAILVEGNLLAAATEIEKLSLLAANQVLDLQDIDNIVTDHARFDIFNLVDGALIGNPQRCLRILKNLAAENTEPTLILWALARELRILANIQQQLKLGASLSSLFNKFRIWDKRQPSVRSFLKRHNEKHCWKLLINAAYIDRIIKGMEMGNTWDALQNLAIKMASTEKF